MIKTFKELVTQDKLSFYSLLISLLLAILIVILFLINYSKLPNEIPLFYSLFLWENQLVKLPQFIILPLVIVLMVMINTILSWQLHPAQYVLKKIINFATILISILILISSIKIIYIFI